MSDAVGRDFVGYGRTPPVVSWPGGARIAVNLVLNFEEGSEYSLELADGFTDSGLIELPATPVAHGARDLASESMFEYGSRAGFWRLMRIFAERQLPMTVFACALAVETQPEAAQAIRDAGHDICCHGWRWIEHFRLSEAEERMHIRRAIDSLTRSMGTRPLGWYCRFGPSVNTRRLLVEEGGFLYDSDAYNDDLPFYAPVGDHRHLVLPYTLTNNDVKFSSGAFGTGMEFYTYLRESFDVLYDEGRSHPKMMSVGMHSRVLGHPGRASGLMRFLDYIGQMQDVWVGRRIDIARHWLAHHSSNGGVGPVQAG